MRTPHILQESDHKIACPMHWDEETTIGLHPLQSPCLLASGQAALLSITLATRFCYDVTGRAPRHEKGRNVSFQVSLAPNPALALCDCGQASSSV